MIWEGKGRGKGGLGGKTKSRRWVSGYLWRVLSADWYLEYLPVPLDQTNGDKINHRVGTASS